MSLIQLMTVIATLVTFFRLHVYRISLHFVVVFPAKKVNFNFAIFSKNIFVLQSATFKLFSYKGDDSNVSFTKVDLLILPLNFHMCEQCALVRRLTSHISCVTSYNNIGIIINAITCWNFCFNEIFNKQDIVFFLETVNFCCVLKYSAKSFYNEFKCFSFQGRSLTNIGM